MKRMNGLVELAFMNLERVLLGVISFAGAAYFVKKTAWILAEIVRNWSGLADGSYSPDAPSIGLLLGFAIWATVVLLGFSAVPPMKKDSDGKE